MSSGAGGGPGLAKLVAEHRGEIYQKELQRIGPASAPLVIYQVAGMVIRDRIWIDFTEGGNGEAYIWMPPGEIWLDTDVSPWEMSYVKLHELREFNMMKFRGLDYEAAHKEANVAELAARRAPWKFEELWRKEVEIYSRLILGA